MLEWQSFEHRKNFNLQPCLRSILLSNRYQRNNRFDLMWTKYPPIPVSWLRTFRHVYTRQAGILFLKSSVAEKQNISFYWTIPQRDIFNYTFCMCANIYQMSHYTASLNLSCTWQLETGNSCKFSKTFTQRIV